MIFVPGCELIRYGISAKHELFTALDAIDKLHVLHSFGHQQLYVVHVLDGVHKSGSLHYAGLAADLRIWYLPDRHAFVEKVQIALGTHYDVVLESNHIHVEFQPKSLP